MISLHSGKSHNEPMKGVVSLHQLSSWEQRGGSLSNSFSGAETVSSPAGLPDPRGSNVTLHFLKMFEVVSILISSDGRRGGHLCISCAAPGGFHSVLPEKRSC